MLQKDKENLELRLQKLKEDAKEDFFEAQQIFLKEYDSILENLLGEDILGLKSLIKAYFEILFAESVSQSHTPDTQDIFQKSLEKALGDLALSEDKKQELSKLIKLLHTSSIAISELHYSSEQLIHDPYFPIIEDIVIDGGLTREEFYALEFSYARSSSDIKKALEILSPATAKRINGAISQYQTLDTQESEQLFREEYHDELHTLEKKGIPTAEVVIFVARSYYKNPGRYKKYEHPKRRLKRTFKLALLRLLRKKLGNIDAQNILERFELGETFFDIFQIIFEILEILPENPQSYEVYSVSNTLEEATDLLSEAEITKQKILAGEKLTTSVSNLISETESELDTNILSKILDEGTDFVGRDIYFRNQSEDAGILADGKKSQEGDEDEEEKEEDEDYSELSPRGAYEAIKEDFIELEKEKTKAFLEGRYDDVDTYNERLFSMQRKLEKLSVILGEEL